MSKGRNTEGEATIVIRRPKKGGGHGHSSGWKIAFADFMTAMMALFIVLWALGQDQATKASISAYFSNPVGIKEGYASGATPISSGASPAQVETVPLQVLMRGQQRTLEQAADRIKEKLNSKSGMAKLDAQVEVVLTKDGLRIELRETGTGETFFPFGSAEMKPVTREALAMVAAELGTLPNPVVVEGHTDGAPFGSRTGYSNWELSSDRAHAARRVLEGNGIGYARIKEVRGYADKQPRFPDRPLDPSNRRITVLLPFIVQTDAADPASEIGDEAPETPAKRGKAEKAEKAEKHETKAH